MLNESPAKRISLVIPAYNEEQLLPRLLDSVEAAAARYSHGPGAVEVVVADNASTDRTAEIALRRGCRVATAAKRCIAAARNAGGSEAKGEIVGFVDADMQIHPGTFDAIERALASPRIIGGATGGTMERWSLGLVVTFAIAVPFVWLTQFDTGVVFCRRADFLTVGGYDESLRVAEDVNFLLALRTLGGRRGQRLRRLRAVKSIASARKFDEHGDWHYLTMFPKVMLEYLRNGRKGLGKYESYWYEPKR